MSADLGAELGVHSQDRAIPHRDRRNFDHPDLHARRESYLARLFPTNTARAARAGIAGIGAALTLAAMAQGMFGTSQPEKSAGSSSSPVATATANPEVVTRVGKAEYDPHTEAAMGRNIKSKAIDIARAALRHLGSANGLSAGKGYIEILGDNSSQPNSLNGQATFDVVMGLTDGRPDPTKVVYADALMDSINSQGGIATRVILSTPQGGEFVTQTGIAEGVRQGGNVSGWTAYAEHLVSDQNGGVIDSQSYIWDTTDRSFFSQDANGDPTDPVRTSGSIAEIVSSDGGLLSEMTTAFDNKA